MESMFDVKYGVAGICVLLAFKVIVDSAKFVFERHKQEAKQKESASEATTKELIKAVRENTEVTKHLDNRIQHLERSIGDLPKLKLDVRRFYTAVKSVAGDKWPAIHDELMRDNFGL